MKGRKEERKQVKLISIHGERQWLVEEERLSGTVRELNNRTDTDAQKRARLLMMMTEKDVAIECKEGKPQKHLVIMNNERARSGGWFEAHQAGDLLGCDCETRQGNLPSISSSSDIVSMIRISILKAFRFAQTQILKCLFRRFVLNCASIKKFLI
jgi:hypothetical protein